MIMLMKMMMMRWEENELQRVTSCKSENPKSHRWHRDSEWIEKPVESESLPDCTKLHQKVLLLDSNLMGKDCNNYFVCYLWKGLNAITSNQWDVWGGGISHFFTAFSYIKSHTNNTKIPRLHRMWYSYCYFTLPTCSHAAFLTRVWGFA